MPFFYSAVDKLYRSIGQAPADISLPEGLAALLFQGLTFPLLVLRQQEHSVFHFQDSWGIIFPAVLRLVANSFVYALAGFLFTIAWAALFRRSHARA